MDPIQIVSDSARKMLATFLSYLPQVSVAIFILILTWICTRLVKNVARRAFRRARLRLALVDLFGKLLSAGIWMLGFFMALAVIFPDLSVANLVGVLGISTIAIGFAFKDIFENFLAGILLLSREPFRIGDYIVCEEVEGKVERINIRDTFIRQNDGERVVVPNGMLFTNPVRVQTDPERHRVSVVCGIDPEADLDLTRRIIHEALEGLKTVDSEKPIEVFVQQLGTGTGTNDLEVRWWTGSTQREMKESTHEVLMAVKQALDAAGIDMPSPQQMLSFREPLKIVQTDREKFRQEEELSTSSH